MGGGGRAGGTGFFCGVEKGTVGAQGVGEERRSRGFLGRSDVELVRGRSPVKFRSMYGDRGVESVDLRSS